MKVLRIVSVMTAVLFCSCAVIHAAQGPVSKFSRGIVNVLTAPIEIPKQARAYWIKGAQKTDHILVWIFSGTVWGCVQGVKRTASGLWDVATFPLEKPQQYESLMKPEFVFQEWPTNRISGR